MGGYCNGLCPIGTGMYCLYGRDRHCPSGSNVARMKMLGATVIPATSGSKTLKDAVNEALRDWINNASTTHYIIGSVVGPHPFRIWWQGSEYYK